MISEERAEKGSLDLANRCFRPLSHLSRCLKSAAYSEICQMTKHYKRKWFHKGGIIRQRWNGYQVEINFNAKRIRKPLDSLNENQWIVNKSD